MELKNIICDFGGVLYSIDQKRNLDSFRLLSAKPSLIPESDTGIFYNDNLFLDYEKGIKSTREFRHKAISRYALSCTDDEFDKAWNATLLHEAKGAREFVQAIREKKNIFLLSNTNELHFDYFFRQCEKLLSLFDFLFLSFKLKMRKPEKEIFEYILAEKSLKPHDTLFIDDSSINITAAESMGIKTLHATTENLSDLFDIVNSL